MNRAHLIGASLLIGCALAAPMAAAETISNPCMTSWWRTVYTPVTFTGLPTEPTVPLPAVWNAYWASPDADLADVTVRVTDADGAEVAGSVGHGFTLPPDDAPYRYGPLADLTRRLWWRPAAPMAPGTYLLELAAKAPTDTQCGYSDLDATLTLTVPAAQPPTATLAVHAGLGWRHSDDVAVVYQNVCAPIPYQTLCADTPGTCCRFSPGPLVEFDTAVIASGLDTTMSYQYALLIEHDSLASSDGNANGIYPVTDRFPETRVVGFRPAPYQMPFPQGSRCVHVRLFSLTLDAVVASAQACAAAQDMAPFAVAPEACDEDACREAAAEPAPEPAAEMPVAEPAEGGGGCDASGPGGGWLAALLLLLAGATARIASSRRARAHGPGSSVP